jgi:archaemetzincin
VRPAALLGLVALAACEDAPATTPAQLRFATTDDEGFGKMPQPQPGDWLDRFDEPGQTFEQYRRSRPVRAGEGEVLAFLPIGPFPERRRRLLDDAVAFARIWFDLDATLLDPAPLPLEGWRRERASGPQYLTTYFLDHLLPDRRPGHAVALFGVTMADLYPQEDWNYVFGQAALRGRVGVWSFARFTPEFWGRVPSPAADALALRRALKLVAHEMGHAFTLEHCIAYSCVMNGSNSLDESDRQPLHLCPACLKKLQWNRGFDVLARYERLSGFYEARGLAAEAGWTAARVARIRAVR